MLEVSHKHGISQELPWIGTTRSLAREGAAAKRRSDRQHLATARLALDPGSADTRRWRRGGDSNPRARLAGLTVFETAAFNRSATSPRGSSRVRPGAAGSATSLRGREVAEREGFEPSRQVTPPTRFPVALLKPARTPLRGARRRAP